MSTVPCRSCKSLNRVATLLDGAAWWRDVNVLKAQCASCDYKIEMRVESGLAIVGYVYAAGQPHFAGMLDYSIGGLLVAKSVMLTVELEGRVWTFNDRKTVSRKRVAR